MKLYRGFNYNYPKTLGVRPEQKGVWLTDDIDYALEYANMFKNGAIAEYPNWNEVFRIVLLT